MFHYANVFLEFPLCIENNRPCPSVNTLIISDTMTKFRNAYADLLNSHEMIFPRVQINTPHT